MHFRQRDNPGIGRAENYLTGDTDLDVTCEK